MSTRPFRLIRTNAGSPPCTLKRPLEAAIAAGEHELGPALGMDLEPGVLVVAAQADDPGRRALHELSHPGDNSRTFGAAVDVVAEEHDSVAGAELGQATEQLGQRREIAMDVADGKGSTLHRIILV